MICINIKNNLLSSADNNVHVSMWKSLRDYIGFSALQFVQSKLYICMIHYFHWQVSRYKDIELLTQLVNIRPMKLDLLFLT